MKKKLFRGVLFLFLGQIGGTLATVLGTPILVRLLSQAEYGDFTFMLSVISTSAILASLGVPDGLRKHATEERDSPNWRRKVIGYYFRTGVILAAVCSIGLLLFSYSSLFDLFLGNRFESYFIIVSFIIFFKLNFNIIRSVLMAHDDEHHSESLKVLIPISYMGLGIILLYFGYGVIELLVSYLFAVVLVTIVGLIKAREYLSLSDIFLTGGDELPRLKLLFYNTHIYLQGLFAMTLLQVDIILITFIIGSEQTAIYKAALIVTEFIWLAPLAIRTRLIYSTSQLWSKNDLSEIQNISEKVTRYTLLLSSLLAIGLVVLAPQFISIYFGNEYYPAAALIYILLPGVVCFAIARPIIGIEFGSQYTRIAVIATVSAAFVNILLNLLLIPTLGISGAAIATSIGYSLMLLFHLASSIKMGFNPIGEAKLVPIIVATAITGAILQVATHVLQNVYVELVFVPILGFCLYSVLIIKLGVIKRDELKSIVTVGKESIPSQVYSD